MGCGFTFVDGGFCYSPCFSKFFLIEISTCCVVFYTIDPFTAFSPFDVDKLGKISLTPLERLL